VIASSFTSPIDPLYLAAIFDPVFTVSYPNSRRVEQISLFQAILRAFAAPQVRPSPGARLVDIASLLKQNPGRPIVTFPECTTTNGRGVLPLSYSLLGVPAKAKIFPVSLRYTPGDVVTPLPGSYLSFLWRLLSRPTHCIRVRIAECVVRGEVSAADKAGAGARQPSYDTNYFDVLEQSDGGALAPGEKALLDQVGDALARLGRVKRVGLGVKEKQDFLRSWTKTRRTW
jgi:1-acyl-sn-glycerol-3-phosphate acyltransferase